MLAAASCGSRNENAPPDRLVDGSPARTSAIRLEGLDGPAVFTAARTERVAAVDGHSPAGSCIANDWGLRPSGLLVERVGVHGESVTFFDSSHREVLGCDNGGGGAREDGRRWCGVAAGRLHAGRLSDPRLDLGCSTGRGRPLGFVWVQPAARARYVAVQQRGYAEIYEVAGGLPVRITTTTDVDLDALRASFAVSEYARDGSLLREYGVTAIPAG